jgi:hypothetical protein
VETVKLNKKELLAKVQANRATHAQEVAVAKELYAKKFVEEAQRVLTLAQEGKEYIHNIKVVTPVDHVKEYDHVIAMLEMSVEDLIELTTSEFAQFVLDEWTWRAHAHLANSTYLAR